MGESDDSGGDAVKCKVLVERKCEPKIFQIFASKREVLVRIKTLTLKIQVLKVYCIIF